MKKMLVFIIFLCISINAQNTPDETAKEEAQKIHLEVVKLFNEGRIKEALPIALKLVELQKKLNGQDHLAVARAYRSVGIVYFRQNDAENATNYLANALRVFEKQSASSLDNETIKLFAEVYDLQGILKYREMKTAEAEKSFLKAIELYSKNGDEQLLKIADLFTRLGNLRYNSTEYEEAVSYYEKSLKIRHTQLGAKDDETIDSFDRCLCALKKNGDNKGIKRLKNTYYADLKMTKDGILEWFQSVADDESGTLTPKGANVVNGKALFLPPPRVLFRLGMRTVVRVKVKIDEAGTVTFACGAFSKALSKFIEPAEKAAYQAKFEPTTIDGQPIAVTGLIVYTIQ